MSEETAKEESARKRGQAGRGRGRGRGGRGGKEGGGSDEKEAYVPIPEDMFNTTQEGRITDTLKTRIGGSRFGFILIGQGKPETLPRIYFKYEDFSDDEFVPRRGYMVTFSVEKDDQGRFVAKNVSLTEDGKEKAAIREVQIKAQQDAQEAAGAEGGAAAEKKPKKARKPRAINDREVTLKLTAEGFEGEREVVAKLGESLGKLKHTCITAFESDKIQLNVFKGDTLLTKSILREMADGDAINLKEMAKEDAKEDAKEE